MWARFGHSPWTTTKSRARRRPHDIVSTAKIRWPRAELNHRHTDFQSATNTVVSLHHQLLTASAHVRHRSRMQRNTGASKAALLRSCIQLETDGVKERARNLEPSWRAPRVSASVPHTTRPQGSKRHTMLNRLRSRSLWPLADDLPVLPNVDARAVHARSLPRLACRSLNCPGHSREEAFVFFGCLAFDHGPRSISFGLSPALS